LIAFVPFIGTILLVILCVQDSKPIQDATTFESPAPNGKSKVAAALLALFTGGLGIHKFYLGQVGLGILYIVFCWTLIPALIGIIEFIIFLTMSDESFNRQYGNT